MKRILGLIGAAVLAWSGIAQAQLPSNYMNMLFFVNGCATYGAGIAFPPLGALCMDTGTGGMYISNGSAFVLGGSEIWSSNGGAGQITATTAFWPASANQTNATTEAITMELPVGPQTTTIRNLACWDSAAPGGATSDAFVVRKGGPGPVAIGSMSNSTLTCTITGSATSCVTAPSLIVTLAGGSVVDMADTTTGVPAARTIACTFQVDEF